MLKMRKAFIAVEVILLFLIVTSLQSYAEDLIYGCINKTNAKLRIVDSPTECKKPEIAFYWNKVVPQGEQEDPGPQGEQGLKRDQGGSEGGLTARQIKKQRKEYGRMSPDEQEAFEQHRLRPSLRKDFIGLPGL